MSCNETSNNEVTKNLWHNHSTNRVFYRVHIIISKRNSRLFSVWWNGTEINVIELYLFRSKLVGICLNLLGCDFLEVVDEEFYFLLDLGEFTRLYDF